MKTNFSKNSSREAQNAGIINRIYNKSNNIASWRNKER